MQTIECTYKVGTSLEIQISAIGSPDSAVYFMKSDYGGDFYAFFGLNHGCVVVSRGKSSGTQMADFAFIQPKNGKVYRDWMACSEGK